MEIAHLWYFLIREGPSLEGDRFAQIRHSENRWESNNAIKAERLATGRKHPEHMESNY